MPNDRLKVCTFNAKCDDFDFCCINETFCDSKCSGKDVPESLVAAMIAIAILPQKSEIYNIQNVCSEKVVQHLVKEISRVHSITDKFNRIDIGDIANSEYEILDAICQLNNLSGLCEDGLKFRDYLAKCTSIKLDYVDLYSKKKSSYEITEDERANLYKYVGVGEYDAYYNGTSLTLVRKDLNLCPTVKHIPGVDSLVIFFEYAQRRFINVNVNLGGLSFTPAAMHCKKLMVDTVCGFLKQYEDCGAVIMSGAMGDLDYDTPQLLFKEDSVIPEIAQKLTSLGVGLNPTPSDFPNDINDPLYELMEFLLKVCKAEHIPYAWLLQYLRLKECGQCGSKKLYCKCDAKHSREVKAVRNIDDCHRSSVKSDEVVGHHVSVHRHNRAQMRIAQTNSDRKIGRNTNDRVTIAKCNKPACVVAKQCKCVCDTECKVECVDKCKVPIKKCQNKCQDRCACEFVPCKNKCEDVCDSKYLVKVDVCKDLCGQSCCGSCKNGAKCESKVDVCPAPVVVDMCDTISVLKKCLCMHNVLNNVCDVNDRYTGFHDHFNPCLDCKFPKGVFQAWAMCKEYEFPKKHTRVIDNNSELLALDHILVSDCLKNNIVCVGLSDLEISKCNTKGCASKFPYVINAEFNPFNRNGSCPDTTNCTPDYSKDVVNSFFTHRVYCCEFDLPVKVKRVAQICGESLHDLGLIDLWCLLDRWNDGCIDICKLEKYHFDRHPYFIDFFYQTVENKFARSTDNGASVNLLLKLFKNKTCSTAFDRLALFQKKNKMTENEFYDHLVCIYSNTDNKDRFILTIGLMSAIVKHTTKIEKTSPDMLLSEGETALAFFVLSECYCERISLIEAIQSVSQIVGLDSAAISTTCSEVACCVGETLVKLNDCLLDDCRVMSILLRFAMRGLDAKGDGNCRFEKSDFYIVAESIETLYEQIKCYLCQGCTLEKMRDIFLQMFNGKSGKQVLAEFIDTCVNREHTVQVLLIIGGYGIFSCCLDGMNVISPECNVNCTTLQ